MAAFKSGERSSQIMHAIAVSLSDGEVATLAEYLAAQPTGTKQSMTWTRRKFGCFAGSRLSRGARREGGKRPSPRPRRGGGGGVGGATVARYLAMSAVTLDVTLVEPKAAIHDLLLQQLLSGRPSLARIAQPRL